MGVEGIEDRRELDSRREIDMIVGIDRRVRVGPGAPGEIGGAGVEVIVDRGRHCLGKGEIARSAMVEGKGA